MRIGLGLVMAWLALGPDSACGTPGPVYEGLSDQPCPAPLDTTEGRRYTDWAWVCRFRDDNAAITVPVQIVYMGDSITEFWARESPAHFGPGVVDRGISGQTSPQMVLRFQQDVIALHPARVHLLAGTNDVAANTGPSAFGDVLANIDTMVTLARAHHIEPILGTLPPAAVFWWRPGFDPRGDIARLNTLIRDYARVHHVRLVDYHAALRNHEDGLGPEYADDGVHPNTAGYRVMEAALARALAQPAP
jgi:lysophospholipase L1-like esterase